jgi:diacylglycerol kinase (ATP)
MRRIPFYLSQLYTTLKRFADARVRQLDAWTIEVEAPSPDLLGSMPHSLALDPGSKRLLKGMFWNYFSVGLDAKAAHAFHSLRERKPWLTPGRLMNQAWYAIFSCTGGWFCGAPPISKALHLRVRGGAGGPEWRDVPLPPSLRAIALLNLQTYGGGRDVWGLDEETNLQRKQFSPPIYDDGLVEVVGGAEVSPLISVALCLVLFFWAFLPKSLKPCWWSATGVVERTGGRTMTRWSRPPC